MGKNTRVAFYLRVSAGSQTAENQRQELARAAEQRGWSVVELYSDNGFSGAKGRDKRPAFDRMCKDAVARKFDVVAAWSVDRLGRSVLHLAQFVEDLRGAGVGLFLLKQGLDSETPTGRAMLLGLEPRRGLGQQQGSHLRPPFKREPEADGARSSTRGTPF